MIRVFKWIDLRVIIATVLGAVLIGAPSAYVSSRITSAQTALEIRDLKQGQDTNTTKISEQQKTINDLSGLDKKMDSQTDLILDRMKSLEQDIRDLRSEIRYNRVAIRQNKPISQNKEKPEVKQQPLLATKEEKKEEKVVDVVSFFKKLFGR